MRSFPRTEATRRSTPLSLLPLLALSACATHIDLTAIAPACAPLVEASGLLQQTPGAQPPPAIMAIMTHPALTDPGALAAGPLAVFADAQTGQLDKANADKAGALRIVQICEARNARAIEAVRPHGLGWGLFHRRPKL